MSKLPVPPEHLDALHLAANCERVRSVLAEMQKGLAGLRREVSTLAEEPGLPTAYHAAYDALAILLSSVRGTVENGVKGSRDLRDDFRATGLMTVEPPPVTPALIQAAAKVIEEIDGAEMRFIASIRDARAVLGGPISCEIAVRFRVDASRQFYVTCGNDQEPAWVHLPYLLDVSHSDLDRDWNIFRDKPDHPLRHGRHGYLVRCLLDHSPICWQMLPSIEALWLNVGFDDSVEVWHAPGRE